MAAAIRVSRHIALEDIAHTTKITLMYLHAIEGGQWGVLPGGVYNTSYIRQYANAIDFDPEALLSAYRRAQGLEPIEREGPDGPRFGLSVLLKRLLHFLSVVHRSGSAA